MSDIDQSAIALSAGCYRRTTPLALLPAKEWLLLDRWRFLDDGSVVDDDGYFMKSDHIREFLATGLVSETSYGTFLHEHLRCEGDGKDD